MPINEKKVWGQKINQAFYRIVQVITQEEKLIFHPMNFFMIWKGGFFQIPTQVDKL